MKYLIILALIVGGVFYFKDDIHSFIVGEMKHMPQAVEKYNEKPLGFEYFSTHGEEAIELKGICAQNSGWRYESVSANFAQNCDAAEASLK